MCVFGRRLKTVCSGIKLCICVERKMLDGGGTSTCIKG